MKRNCKRCNYKGSLSDKIMTFNPMINEWLCEECKNSLGYKFAAFKEKFLESNGNVEKDSGFFPPPWDFVKYPEKTEGWLEFQKESRKHPEYYLKID